MCHICGNEKRTFNTQAAYKRHVKNAYIDLGYKPLKAKYDNAGNCILCGESGRCPGWHLPFENSPLK